MGVSVPEVKFKSLEATGARGFVFWHRLRQRRRLLDDPAAQHARLAVGRLVEHAGLARRHAILAGDEIDLDAVRTTAEPGGTRRPGRAHSHEHLVPAGAERLLNA